MAGTALLLVIQMFWLWPLDLPPLNLGLPNVMQQFVISNLQTVAILAFILGCAYVSLFSDDKEVLHSIGEISNQCKDRCKKCYRPKIRLMVKIYRIPLIDFYTKKSIIFTQSSFQAIQPMYELDFLTVSTYYSTVCVI